MWELDGNLVYEELFIKRTAERSSMGIQIRLQSSTIRKFKRGENADCKMAEFSPLLNLRIVGKLCIQFDYEEK